MVQLTDKSGETAVISVPSYIESMQPRVAGNPEVSWEEKKSLEKSLNGHTLQLGRALKVGERWKHCSRVKSALRNKYCHIPVLAGFMKTHKQWQPGQPPPQRPVAGADEANNAQLSELLAEIVMAITALQDKESEVLLRSIEEACAEFERINNREDLSEFVLFSTDISAMFPSLDIPEVAKSQKNI